jgi:hypothetical protein
MSTLTVTAKGQVTLRKDLLDHRGESSPADWKDIGCFRFLESEAKRPRPLD